MENQDFYKPISIRDTIFAGIDLPEQSKIQKPSSKTNKYEQQDDDDQVNFDLGLSGLGEVSKVQPNQKYEARLSIIKQSSDIKKEQGSSNFTRPNSSEKSSSSEKSLPQQKASFAKKTPQQIRRQPANIRSKKDSKKPPVQNRLIDLDQQIGEVREWAHRDQDEKSSDFDKSDQEHHQEPKVNKQLQDQLRRKAEQKAKMLSMKIQNKSYGSQPKGLGLKGKLEELKKKNQQSNNNASLKLSDDLGLEQSTDNLKIQLNPVTTPSQPQKQPPKESSRPSPTQSQNPTTTKPTFQAQASQSQDDPWQKINEQTKQQYQKKNEQQSQPLTKEQVIEFYCKKFIFAEDDIIVEFDLDDIDEEEVPTCWDSLFGCFKTKDSREEGNDKQKNTKDRLALRLVAISKISVSNTDEEFFVLKEIWTKLTGKPFSRYGNHWNQIGFQGRDPATDLRSTGVLSIIQWYLFIDQDLSAAKDIYDWTLQKDFPLGLTHIKATGLFLKLIKSGKIKAKSWNQYQKYYNCIAWNVFNRIKKGYDQSQNVGEVVDKNLQNVRKNLGQCIKQYQQRSKE